MFERPLQQDLKESHWIKCCNNNLQQ